jgi:hypothetical protein
LTHCITTTGYTRKVKQRSARKQTFTGFKQDSSYPWAINSSSLPAAGRMKQLRG